VSARARPDTTTAARAIKPAAEEEVVAPEVADAEFVPLDEADAEAQGKMTADGEVPRWADRRRAREFTRSDTAGSTAAPAAIVRVEHARRADQGAVRSTLPVDSPDVLLLCRM